jgi:hypothetical protein
MTSAGDGRALRLTPASSSHDRALAEHERQRARVVASLVAIPDRVMASGAPRPVAS